MRRPAVVIICWRISAVTGKRRKDIKNAEKTITGTKGRRDRNEERKERGGGREIERKRNQERRRNKEEKSRKMG